MEFFKERTRKKQGKKQEPETEKAPEPSQKQVNSEKKETTQQNNQQKSGRSRGKKVETQEKKERPERSEAKKTPRSRQSASKPKGKTAPAEGTKREPKISIIPLGGLGEIGKNMTAIKYGNSMIVVDCGIMFPEDDMPGIDTVIPDYTYLIESKKKIKAIVLTHGHEDHIGALPYVLRDINVPVYGTRMTMCLVAHKLKEAKVQGDLHEVKARDVLNISPFKVEFIRVNHSIADSVAIAIHTPAGTIVMSGDFKIDMTPVDGEIMDFARFAALGEKGVLALCSDSTNAELPGTTKSEKSVGSTFDETFKACKGRIILATFATNVHRLQQAINAASKYNRKVAIVGRSMVNVVNIASEQGYLKVPKNTLVDIDQVDQYSPNKVMILATGSQGEPMSTLTRIANSEHKQIKLLPGDTIIVSAVPIPGNEISVSRNIDALFKLGAEVIYESDSDVHVSGHARQEEQKMLISLVRPQYFIPVHGEVRMLYKHAATAKEMGIEAGNIFVLENGQILELSKSHAEVKGSVPAGQIMIDGMGYEDVGNVVLHDRRQLANDGFMVVIVTVDKLGSVVASPEFITRGFIYVKEAEVVMEKAKLRVRERMEKYEGKKIRDFNEVKQEIKECVGKTFYEHAKRKPMIIPVIIEVD